jgi:hypothetical protein
MPDRVSLAAPRPPDAEAATWDGVVLIAAFMAAASALVHLSLAPAHFGEWWVFGALFLLAAALQMGLAVVLLRAPTRAAVGATVAVNAGLVLAWFLSRTTGLPVGPDVGVPEVARLLDVLTSLDEVLLILLLVLGSSVRVRPRLVVACQGCGTAVGLILLLAFVGGVGHG